MPNFPHTSVVCVVASIASLALLGSVVGADATPGHESHRTQVTSAIVGDPAAVRQEVRCITAYAKNPSHGYANYAAAIGAPEVTDAVHSGLQPCATFTGSFTGRNQVAQYLSPTVYPGGIQIVVQGGPKAAFLIGGAPGTPVPGYVDGPYVARFDPGTGAQIWRRALPTMDGQWIVAPSMAVVKGGWIDVIVGPRLYVLDPTSGAILKQADLPVLDGDAIDSNYDGFAVATDRGGAILLKSQARSTGCPIQGNLAMSDCIKDYGPQPNTTVVAVDPKTLATIATLELNEPIAARPTVVPHGKQTYFYLAGATTGVRVIWDPRKRTLTQDTTWRPPYLQAGQTVGDAPAPLGNWVVFTTNASPASVPMCAVVVSQRDSSNVHRVCPWGSRLPAGATGSETPASYTTDPQNSMFFLHDLLVGGVFAVHLDQRTGALTVPWSRPDWRTSDYLATYGDAKHRVLVSQYMNPSFTTANLKTGVWTESVLWADEATGRTIAQSAYNGPTDLGWMPMPGYAGRWYTMSAAGSLIMYAVSSCEGEHTPVLSPPSTTGCTTDRASLPQPVAWPVQPN